MCMEGLGRGRERAVNRASGISSQDFSSFQENYIWKEYIKMMLEPQEKAAWTKWHKNLVTDQKEKKKSSSGANFIHSSEAHYKYLKGKYKVSCMSPSNW